MRVARLVGEGRSYYHVVSRVIERRFALDPEEKERFRIVLRRIEAFTGVKVVTYAIMSNHIHLLLDVDGGAPVSQAEVFSRLHGYYKGQDWVAGYAARVMMAREAGNDAAADALLDAYRYRMNDLSEFMKALMQSYTVSYNRRHGRRGTLWEGRFKSVLVEGRGNALAMIAAYIDLNPVRAGIVTDPKHYRYCGYGEAVAGRRIAQQGLALVLATLQDNGPAHWDQEAYRTFVFMQGLTHAKGAADSETFRARAEAVIADGGKLSPAELLHCRVRYFSDGAVLGSRSFVQDMFVTHRTQFGLRRKRGPRPIRHACVGDLFTMRDLRVSPVGVSSS